MYTYVRKTKIINIIYRYLNKSVQMDKQQKQEHYVTNEEDMRLNHSKYNEGDVIHILTSNQLGSSSYVKIKDGFKELILVEE